MSDLSSAPGVVARISATFSGSVFFLQRQRHDWKVTVVRTSLERFAYQMVFPYLSIYIVALGATATQLGLLNSLGMIIAGIVAPFSGWIIDKTGPRKMYLFGIGLLAVCYLTYALAQNWLVTIIAIATYWLGFSVSIHSCATVCGNCLANKDRATGMMICETVAAGLLGMLGPILGSWIVTMNGGATISGIRPLFFICLGITIVTFIVVLVQLSNTRWAAANPAQPHFLRDFQQVMKEGRHLKKWLLIAAVGQFPAAMVFPFSQLYAYEVRHATPFILGAMVTGAALTSIIFAVPLGRFADRIGRKRVLYITIPLFWISNLLLVWSPAPVFLVFAGILQGFFYLSSPISAAMERELIPPHQMGRWLGLARFFRMPLAAGMAFISGIIWDRVGPQYVFLIFILLDLVVRLPLLVKMPETLSLRLRTSGLS